MRQSFFEDSKTNDKSALFTYNITSLFIVRLFTFKNVLLIYT